MCYVRVTFLKKGEIREVRNADERSEVRSYLAKALTPMQETAARSAEQGMVRTHAQTIVPATPQRTALNLCIEPTPMIEPVIVWVVLMGTPRAEEIKSTVAAPVSAQKPSTGVNFATFWPIVLTIRHPPNIVPSAMAAWQLITTQRGT
jgi:hypothetical protein